MVHAPDNAASKSGLARLEKQIAREKAELADRDLRIFHVGEIPKRSPGYATKLSETESSTLRARLGFSGEKLQLVLIGKDGGVKRRQSGDQIGLESLFALIDTMPMRRQEMRKR